jgi:hypothetical protein
MKWYDEAQDMPIDWCWVAPFDDMLAEAIEPWIEGGNP